MVRKDFTEKSQSGSDRVFCDVRKYLDDEEMLELVSRVLEKLENMSDEEFAELEFVAAD